jgi:hypothetical protein
MVARARTALFRGVNMYVPGMQYASDMQIGAPGVFSLGTPAVEAASALSAAAGLANALVTYPLNFELDSRYGRGVRVDFSGVPGTNAVIRLLGEDYLGQPITKDFTGAAAATTTTASGVVAWKRITAARVTLVASNAVQIQIGTLKPLGLPYKSEVMWSRENNVPLLTAAAQAGAVWTLPVLTDPATLATGDPRGTYTPVATLNGVLEIIVALDGDNSVNAANNGGLHGIRHFSV